MCNCAALSPFIEKLILFNTAIFAVSEVMEERVLNPFDIPNLSRKQMDHR